MVNTLHPQQLTPDELRAVRAACERPQLEGGANRLDISTLEQLARQPRLIGVLFQALEALHSGRGVAIVDVDESFSVSEAAEILNVPEGYALQLFQSGVIENVEIDGVRTAKADAVISYRNSRRDLRRTALDELAAEGQLLGLGY